MEKKLVKFAFLVLLASNIKAKESETWEIFWFNLKDSIILFYLAVILIYESFRLFTKIYWQLLVEMKAFNLPYNVPTYWQ